MNVTGDFADDYTQTMADRVIWHNNLYQRTGIVPAFNLNLFTDTDQIIGDPFFANTGSLTAVDYAPHAFPLILNAGVTVSNIPGDSVGLKGGLDVTSDFFGDPVIGRPDMGAIEVESGFSSLLSWLQTNGIRVDTDLTTDLNSDGVSLLTAYSLNLNPNQDLSGSMPRIAHNTSANTMDMIYYGQSDHINYEIQECTNLLSGWTSFQNGSLSSPDSNGLITVTVPLTNQLDHLFLRLRCTLM